MRPNASSATSSGAKPVPGRLAFVPSERRSIPASREFCWYCPVKGGAGGGVQACGEIGTGQRRRYRRTIAIKATRIRRIRLVLIMGCYVERSSGRDARGPRQTVALVMADFLPFTTRFFDLALQRHRQL